MKVYVEIDGKWEYADQADLVGPLAFRNMVVPINLSKHTGQEVRIKLSAGFMLWELDYAGLDFSDDSEVEKRIIQATTALTQDSVDVRKQLSTVDQSYLEQLMTGDAMTAEFRFEEEPGLAYDYVLYSRGYYNHVREYEGLPEVTTLLSFKKDGKFSEFSKEKFDEMQEIMKVAEISASVKRDPELN
jgi:hypothetical protein